MLFSAGLVAAVFLVYRPVWDGGFLWDDKAHVTRPDLRSLQGLWRIWFDLGATQQHYPLVHSAFWLQYRLWGENPAGYHLFNLGLHCVVALMVALILRQLAVPGAYLAAAIFALHPVHVESVAWISEQKNTLSAVFYLGAAAAWLRFKQKDETASYLLALGLFVLALCSKTVTATLPAALLLIGWWQHGRLRWRRDVVPLIPFFVLAAAAGLSTVSVERRLVGAEGAAFDLTLIDRGLIAGRAIWFYLGKIIWPANLIFIYPRWHVSQADWLQYLYPAAAILVLGALWTAWKRWRGPLAGALFFVGTLFPALGFFNVYPFLFSFVADHFQYLASLGVIALAAAGITRLLPRRPLRYGSSLAILSALAVLTWKQSHLYADVETLYRATIRANPECWLACNNLAVSLMARGARDEAAGLLERALQLKPDYAEAHDNLGFILAGRGEIDSAIAHYRQALESDPGNGGIHYDLAMALLRKGRIDPAVAHLRTALDLSPEYAEAHNGLGVVLAQHGQTGEALFHFQQAVDLKPEYAEAHNNLGSVLAGNGRLEEAIAHFRRALEIEPASAEARKNLDLAVVRRQRVQEGVK